MATSFEAKAQKAFETWTETNREAYQALAKGMLTASERNTQLAQTLFETGVTAMQAQAETARAALETIATAAEKQWQAISALAPEGTDGYGDILSAPFSYYSKWVEALNQATRR